MVLMLQMVQMLQTTTMVEMERTLMHSAARELKILIAPGRPVLCMHPQRIWRRGVVTPPPATLAVLMWLRDDKK